MWREYGPKVSYFEVSPCTGTHFPSVCMFYEINLHCGCYRPCRPSSLDAFVFGFMAPLHKAALPSCPLQSHLRQLANLTGFIDNILAVYFSGSQPGEPPTHDSTSLGKPCVCTAHTKTQ